MTTGSLARWCIVKIQRLSSSYIGQNLILLRLIAQGTCDQAKGLRLGNTVRECPLYES